MSSNEKTFCDPCRFERKDSVATVYCQTCLEYYCKKCKKQHLKFRLTMGHLMININGNWSKNYGKSKSDFDLDNSHIHYGIEQKDASIDEGVRTCEVDVLETSASKRCNLSGKYTLLVNKDGLTLTDSLSHVPVFWPFTCIRKFGSMDDMTFYFECGRRCWCGEGRFVMLARGAVNLHKTVSHLIRALEKRSSPTTIFHNQ